MKGSGKGGDPRKNRKKNNKRRGENSQSQNRSAQGAAKQSAKQGEGSKKGKKSTIVSLINEGKFVRKRVGPVNRLKWTSPQPPALKVDPAVCILCEKPIKEFATAVCDPMTGKPAHFDCTVSRIAERERLEKGDTIGYIGGGRFGIIHFSNPQNPRKFQIKKIFEWERNEIRSEWRVALCEHFSAT